MTVPTPPTFASLADYDAWSRAHMVELNRLAVTDPAEWERIAARIEALLARLKRQSAPALRAREA